MLGLKLTLKFWFFINHLSNHHDLDCHCFLCIAMNHSYILNAMVGIITEYLYSRTNEKQKQILWWSLECHAIIYRKLKLSRKVYRRALAQRLLLPCDHRSWVQLCNQARLSMTDPQWVRPFPWSRYGGSSKATGPSKSWNK